MNPKFRAYIKNIDLMLYDVDVYANGHIGICIDDLEKQLRKNNSLERVYDFDGEEISCFTFSYAKDVFISPLLGDSYIWFDDNQFDLMQWTGIKDSQGNDIYQGDIIQVNYKSSTYEYVCKNKQGEDVLCHGDDLVWGRLRRLFDSDMYQFKNNKVIGNIHQNKELLK